MGQAVPEFLAVPKENPMDDLSTQLFDDLVALDSFMSDRVDGKALGSRSVLDQATGLLMTGLGYDAFEAFDLMSSASRDSNRPVGVVAQGLVDSEARVRQLCTSSAAR